MEKHHVEASSSTDRRGMEMTGQPFSDDELGLFKAGLQYSCLWSQNWAKTFLLYHSIGGHNDEMLL